MSLVFAQITPSFLICLLLVEELINNSFTSLRSFEPELSSLVLGILSCKISQHSSFFDDLLDDLLDNLLTNLLWDIIPLFIHRRFGHWYLLGWHILDLAVDAIVVHRRIGNWHHLGQWHLLTVDGNRCLTLTALIVTCLAFPVIIAALTADSAVHYCTT
jgi:hypothetical protein